jgi:hypothetical protein
MTAAAVNSITIMYFLIDNTRFPNLLNKIFLQYKKRAAPYNEVTLLNIKNAYFTLISLGIRINTYTAVHPRNE